MEFTSWDTGLRSDYLEHHGIPGMKWGVRRFQNEDGSLTSLGQARYGEGGKGARARTMQRHFNKLGAGYANVNAERHYAVKRMNKLSNKAMNYAAKKNLNSEEAMSANKKMSKYGKKIQKSAAKAKEAESRMRAIDDLQRRILTKANEAGYTTKSKNVVRLGNTAKQRYGSVIAAALAGGGVIPGLVIGGIRGSRAVETKGKRVKIRSNYS